MSKDEKYMRRCLDLSRLGSGSVAPNPLVGAVLVHGDRIIGEGYHQRFGEAHAEVNCIRNVPAESRHFIPESTLYVSLEPCAHQGKTPPCTDLIVREKIPRVVIGCRDPFPGVNGKGMERLHQAGIEVFCGLLEQECMEMNRRFFTSFNKGRPYVVLKWAQSADGFIAGSDYRPVSISHPVTNRLVHRWRSEESAILVGTRTALIDNPALSNRLWTGPQPNRLVIDRNLGIPPTARLLDNSLTTWVFNAHKNETDQNTRYVRLDFDEESLPGQLLDFLHLQNIRSVLVEGGARLHQSFIRESLWDEARVISAGGLSLGAGVAAPQLMGGRKTESYRIMSDEIVHFRNQYSR